MATTMKTKEKKSASTSNKEIGKFIGEIFAFNNSLKLYHWHVTGEGSYAQHMALDQALEALSEAIDRITETTYAMIGNIDVVIPETKTPKNIVQHTSDFFIYIEEGRVLFPENFSQAILDDYQEALQQLNYRLMRLK